MGADTRRTPFSVPCCPTSHKPPGPFTKTKPRSAALLGGVFRNKHPLVLVAVQVRLEGSIYGDLDIIGLLGRQFVQFNANLG